MSTEEFERTLAEIKREVRAMQDRLVILGVQLQHAEKSRKKLVRLLRDVQKILENSDSAIHGRLAERIEALLKDVDGSIVLWGACGDPNPLPPYLMVLATAVLAIVFTLLSGRL